MCVAMISKKFWPSFKPDMSRYDAKVEAEKAARRRVIISLHVFIFF
jgi:hypothetical protein